MKKITAKDYLKIVEWSEEDQCFIGSAPPLIGHCCHGATEEEVIKHLTGIVHEWVDLYNKEGKKLPSPMLGGKYSGRFVLRTGENLHRALAIRAQQSGESLNNFVVKALEGSIA
jgi:predicted HicB family RNase H-like nuclease